MVLEVCPPANTRESLIEKLHGQTLGDPNASLEVTGVLGEGMLGYVLKARETRGSKELAMKAMPVEPKTTILKRMLNEVENMKACGTHPNVVQFYGSYIDQGVFYLAMEHVNGMDAFDLRGKAEIPYACLAYITKGVLCALELLHNKLNILHCDIKPENVFLSVSGDVKVGDFGLSVPDSEEDKGNCGTMVYMAPEIFTDSQYSYGVDIWALGIVVFALAERTHPYSHIASASNKVEITDIIRHSRYIPALPDHHPENMKAFVDCCMSPKSTRPTAKQLIYHPWLHSICTKKEMGQFVADVRDGVKPKVTECQDQVSADDEDYINYYAGITLPK